MLINDKITQWRKGSVAAISFRLLVLLMCAGFFGALPAFGQAEYSDAYIIDNSGQYYDPGADATVLEENYGAVAEMVGVGVSEAAYNSNTYSTSTYTTVRTPSGSTSVSASSGGYNYARAEAISIQLNPETAEEGDYEVSSQHEYYIQGGCTNPYMECWMVKSSPDQSQTQFARASYSKLLSPNSLIARSALAQWYYGWTYYYFSIRTVLTGHQYIPRDLGGGGCPARNPYMYGRYCISTYPCNFGKFCWPMQSPYLQGYGIRFTAFGALNCIVSPRPSAFPPRCT